jgi:ATP-dependent phosphofructokinase / diphosphate-dependent phosphofructokinase
MGRHSGWIGCFAGIATGADYVLVPEVPIDLPHLTGVLSRRRASGKKYGIVIVAEGAKFPDQDPLIVDTHPDAFGHLRLGGIGAVVADAIERQLRCETRLVVLGHLQRGGSPSAADRVLATRLGLAASRLVLQRHFGTMVSVLQGQITEIKISEGAAATKSLDLAYYSEAAAFFR